MDDSLVDAARRVLFACTGVRKQEHPDLRQLGEFLHRYSLTQVSGSGEVGRCGAEDQPVFEYAPTRFRRRRNGVGSYVLHDSYQDAVLRAGGLARGRIDLELLHKAVPKSWVPIVAASSPTAQTPLRHAHTPPSSTTRKSRSQQTGVGQPGPARAPRCRSCCPRLAGFSRRSTICARCPLAGMGPGTAVAYARHAKGRIRSRRSAC